MKILHQVNSLGIGGVETFVYRLCKYSNEDVAVYSHKDGPVRKWLEEIGVPVYFGDIEDVLQQTETNIVVMHTGSYYPDYAINMAKKYPDLKFISVMHTICAGEPWVDAIVAISNAVFDIQADKNKSHLITPGIEKSEFFIIGEVTRLAPYKYIEDILKIIEILKTNGIGENKIKFRIIGNEAADAPGYLEELKKMVAEKNISNYIKFSGYLDKVNFKDFDVFIHLVGQREAYPVTLLEALDNNIPVISSFGSGTVEIKAAYLEYPLHLVNTYEEAANIIINLYHTRIKDIRECAGQFTEVYEKVMNDEKQ